jgi:hypothetical protein
MLMAFTNEGSNVYGVTYTGFERLFVKFLLQHLESSENRNLCKGIYMIKYANNEVKIMVNFD